MGDRGVPGTRVLQGLLALTKKHSSESLEKACEIALAHGCWQLQTIRLPLPDSYGGRAATVARTFLAVLRSD